VSARRQSSIGPSCVIIPKRQVAADLGVSTEALSEAIRVATLGGIDANLAKFNAGAAN